MKRSIKNVCNALLLLPLMLCSCGTQRNNSNSVQAKTQYVERVFRDSVFMHDSVFVKQQADTVIFTRYKTIFRDRVRVDTLWRCDTLQIVKEVIKEHKSKNFLSFKNLLLVALVFLLLWKSGIISIIKKE